MAEEENSQPQPQVPAPAPVTAPTPGKPSLTAKLGGGCGLASLIAAVLLLLVVLGGVWWYYHNFHAKPFNPVVLNDKEQAVLDEKLETLGVEEGRRRNGGGNAGAGELGGMRPVTSGGPAESAGPELSDEEKLEVLSLERRTITITEKEINAILNHNTDLEERLKIFFYNDAIGAEVIVDVPEDTPVLGGKTVRAKAVVVAYIDLDGRVAVIVDDVSLNGVPLPNAWLGDIKGKNLMDQYENRDPFLRALARGIQDMQVKRGEVRIILAK